jgi:hypothetical protein
LSRDNITDISVGKFLGSRIKLQSKDGQAEQYFQISGKNLRKFTFQSWYQFQNRRLHQTRKILRTIFNQHLSTNNYQLRACLNFITIIFITILRRIFCFLIADLSG